MKKILLLIVLCTFSLNLQASFIASNNAKIDPNRPTHILVAGSPGELGELFIYSLLTRAKIYLEKSPDEQIIIVGRNDDKEYIKNAGFKIIDTKMGQLKADRIKDAVSNVKLISSIDLYAHANAASGVLLDTNTWIYQLLNENDDLWDEVAKKISNESFIFIHGCNAGIKLAPELAGKLKIAVFAALTSTDFQFLFKDNFWAFDNLKGVAKSKVNNINYSTPKSCGMYCTRMKPDNAPYRGHWGDWTAGGYPAYKLFCGSNQNDKCEKGALEGVFTFPSMMKYAQTKKSLENFKDQLVEFMCPFAFNSEKQAECRSKLENSLVSNGELNYSPFKGKTLVCDRVKCKAHFNCSPMKGAFRPNLCTLESESPSDEVSTSFTAEYRFLISIYNKYFL